jgi:hypothetical protein
VPAETKKWGPVHGIRQSSRFTNIEGKTMLQLAQEITKKKTLEIIFLAASKLKGITKQNPFDILANSSLRGMANTRGVVIPSLEETESISSECFLPLDVNSKSTEKLVADLIRNSSLDIEPQADHPKDETYNEDFPDALNWSQLGKKHRRGKHPMKSMFK